ncbi:MAG: lysophospholipid acyltransferase family protein [Candidatus Promineifilaceae bacterium]
MSKMKTKKVSVNIPPSVPRQGNKLTRFLFMAPLRMAGWRIDGALPDTPKFVAIGAPHTSNWDFLVAMAVIFGLGVAISWMGKHTFVNGPLKPLLLRMGGVPIDRRAPGGVVGQMIEKFNREEKFIVAIAPEGTRSKVDRWKTGFYHIAVGANVPIVPIALDYKRKLVRFLPAFYPTGDVKADLPKIQALYTVFQGKNPEKF